MFIIGLLLIFIAWLLWNICQNTNDALDKQTAIQYEILSLEKRLEEVLDKLTTEQRPATEDARVHQQVQPVKQDSSGDKLNINQASLKALSSLPRIGKAMAQRIIDARPFDSVEGLLAVQGISEEMLSEIKDKIEV